MYLHSPCELSDNSLGCARAPHLLIIDVVNWIRCDIVFGCGKTRLLCYCADNDYLRVSNKTKLSIFSFVVFAINRYMESEFIFILIFRFMITEPNIYSSRTIKIYILLFVCSFHLKRLFLSLGFKKKIKTIYFFSFIPKKNSIQRVFSVQYMRSLEHVLRPFSVKYLWMYLSAMTCHKNRLVL